MLLACRPEKNDTSTGNMELEDGRVLSNVKLVAAVRSFEESSTNVLYTVEDGTGLFEVKQWVDDSSCTALTEIRQPTLHENVYVKVIGHVKAYDGRAVLVANSVRRVGTSNELAHHLLEAVYVGERHKRKASSSSSAASGMGGAGSVGSGVGFGGAAARPFLGPPSGAPLAAHGSAGQGGAGGGRSLADAVLAWVRDRSRDDPNTGANMPDCIRELAGRDGHAEHEIRRAFADLTDEGHIYSTFDENHYTCV
jgi:replication factor A2